MQAEAGGGGWDWLAGRLVVTGLRAAAGLVVELAGEGKPDPLHAELEEAFRVVPDARAG